MNHEIHKTHEKILYGNECDVIRGAIFEVCREMGCGFLAPVYQECLERELLNGKIPFISQKELAVMLKGKALQQIYKPDLICYEKNIVELKAAREITPEPKAQLFNYLRATGL